VTLLFTDLVSSTELLGRLGEAGAEEMRRTHFALLRRAVADAGGDEVKTLGDGLMVAFTSPLDGVKCAIAMQQAVAEYNRDETAPSLGIRVGLHAGEPTRDEGDYFGSAVVVAKRLCDRAEGGQILASEVVAGLVGPGQGLAFLPVGRLRLKGLTDPTAAVLVDWEEPEREAAPGPRPPPVRKPRPARAFSPRPARPALVGRGQELARLEDALAAAAGGVGRMAFVVGEMGVGKTRLAEEALDLAREKGFNVLVGRTGQANSGLAYAPFLSAFGSFLRRQSSVQREPLLDGLVHLARLWPDLGLVPPPPLADPELERTLLFESVARLLERIVSDTPAVVLLDDLHWADAGSLALLSYLTHGVEEMPALLLGTYRPEGLVQSRLLRQLVTDALRSGLASEVTLSGLGDDEVAAMAQGLLGADASPDLVAMLQDRTAGTPLFVDALVRGLQSAGVLVQAEDSWRLVGEAGALAVPRGVRDLVIDRLDSLADAERSVVTLIAHDAAGLPHDVLEEASELDGQTLLDVIGGLVGSGLLLQDTDGVDIVYRLFHPLVQEVAAAELPAVAGRRIHSRLAVAVERHHAADLDRLAFHYARAGPDVDPGRAVTVLLDAGERAYSLAAHEQAAGHFGAALPFVRHGHRTEQLSHVLERLGESWAAVGETGAAREVWAEAVAERQREGDLLSAARICRRSALAARDRGDEQGARQQLEAGVALLAGQPPSDELVLLHHAGLQIDSPLLDPERAAPTVEALAAAADTVASPAAKATSLSAEAQLALGYGDYALARSKAEASLRAADASGDLLLVQRARRDLAWINWADIDVSSLEQQAAAQLELDRRLGARALEPLSRAQFALVAHFRGNWDDLEPMMQEAIAQARRYGQGRVLAICHGGLAWWLIDQGHLDRAEEHLEEARRNIDPKSADRALILVCLPEALLALERGETDRARTIAARVLLPKGRLILAEVHLQAGELEAAGAIGRRLAAAGAPGSYAAAIGDRILGLVAQAEGAGVAATELLTRSAAALAARDLPFEAAVSEFHIGTTENLRTALASFDRLGAERWADRARRSLRALGIRVQSPRRRFPTPGDQPLSRRELEVARLVSEGLPNAEIAARLVLSVRTVESHLDHIYARLGISSRAALASWVTTNKLADP
jgi:class 3 adenylate cyclase/DNA-binding CsgD family transcriptional regulator